jgi:hypothetical protein
MEAILEQVEHLAAVLTDDHQLAVEDVAPLREGDLREVATQRLAAARLEVDLLSVDIGERSEAVVLGLIGPILALGENLAGERQLRLDRRLQGERDFPILVAS